jgi:hypothetical protein
VLTLSTRRGPSQPNDFLKAPLLKTVAGILRGYKHSNHSSVHTKQQSAEYVKQKLTSLKEKHTNSKSELETLTNKQKTSKIAEEFKEQELIHTRGPLHMTAVYTFFHMLVEIHQDKPYLTTKDQNENL